MSYVIIPIKVFSCYSCGKLSLSLSGHPQASGIAVHWCGEGQSSLLQHSNATSGLIPKPGFIVKSSRVVTFQFLVSSTCN